MEQMTGLDSRFLFSETAATHMHTIKVAVVDVSARSTPLTPERLLGVLDARLARMPVLRKRVVAVPHGLGNPVVIDDPDFDVNRHIRHLTVGHPGGTRQLDEVVASIAAVPLERDRPLWELTVVEGLAGGQVAFVVKIHHALADGVAAVAMLMNAFVLDDSDAIIERFRPEPIPSDRSLYRAAVSDTARALRSMPGFAAESLAGLRRVRAARRRESTEVLGPFAGPRTPLNVPLTAERSFASLVLPMRGLLAAKRHAGVSLNDIFLTVAGGGLRRYLARTGDLPDASLVASVPMATETDQLRLGGNHVDNLFVSLHSDMTDAIERSRAIHSSTSAARRVRSALGTGLFERRSGLVPPRLYTVSSRAVAASRLAARLRPPVNIVASNVAGPRNSLELEGGVITALYSSGPILEGIGLNITAWSYCDALYVSLLGCPASLPDPWLLADDIEAEARDLFELAESSATG